MVDSRLVLGNPRLTLRETNPKICRRILRVEIVARLLHYSRKEGNKTCERTNESAFFQACIRNDSDPEMSLPGLTANNGTKQPVVEYFQIEDYQPPDEIGVKQR